ncbi:MAG: benzoate-CoA ligase family protein [Candidatus Rokubacteria bacterium]|nr:benzoate-CoA ligase family protein [Candidatus Rokubacteria bacterium]
MNAVTAFLDDQVRAGRGERAAIETPSGRATYADLLALANRTGNGLRAFGVEPEQRVALLLPDGLAWAATFFGALRIGAVAVPLSTRLRPAEWAVMLRDSRARALVVDASLVAGLRELGGELRRLRVLVAGGSAADGESLEALQACSSIQLRAEPVGEDAMAFWLYTSGTTGAPKAAVHAHRDLLACRHYGVDVLGAHEGDRVFATSKLFFAYALGTALLIPLYVGGGAFLHGAWPDPALVADVMARWAPTLFFSVPTVYARLLGANLPRDTFASLRCAVSAGERLPVDVYWAWRERFGVEVLDGLGATETIFMVLSNRPGRSRAGSSGTPVPATDAKLLAAGGREVETGEQGVLHVRTPSASPSYWNRIDESRRTFVGEWFRTGDVCTRDADGFFFHCGREDDLFKVAGLWVVPADVETLLLAHPGVADAGVVGAPEGRGLIKPFAFVVPKERGADPRRLAEDLAGLAAAKLPSHARPRKIFVVDELPRTATGKLQRFRLRARVADA